MKHITGWFRRNNLIMLQAQNLAKQLQEAWAALEMEKAIGVELVAENVSILTQLHRVARERDNERKLRLETYGVCQDAMNQIGAERSLRLAAEDALLDICLDDETNLSVKVSDGDAWLVFPNAALSIEGICKFGAPGPIVKRNLREWRDNQIEQAKGG